MYKKLLIANRGEIACRIISTAKKLGLKTVAVCSDVDLSAPHVLLADEFINIGGNTSVESYLKIERHLSNNMIFHLIYMQFFYKY